MPALLLAIACLGPTESTWRIDTPPAAVIAALKQRADDLDGQLPPNLVQLLGDADVIAEFRAELAVRRYTFTISAHGRRLGVCKTLEVLADDAGLTLTSTVDLSLGRDGRLIGWLLSRVERRVLAFERKAIEQLTKPSS